MRIEEIRARRRTRRSRWRCSESPSTRHDRNEPRLSCWTPLGIRSGTETARGSSGITHLQSFFCENLRIIRRAERSRRNLRRWPSGSLNSTRRPAPRSQGCEVARVLETLDTAGRHKFPGSRVRSDKFQVALLRSLERTFQTRKADPSPRKKRGDSG